RGPGVYGARVVLLIGAGGNGGDALYAGARLVRRGAGVTALLLAPAKAHAGGLAALAAAGGRGAPSELAGPTVPEYMIEHGHANAALPPAGR
ncbi:hypothetical protein K4H04_22865, partial [Mycobacterium tuberculosis]|nr:hypothetical protein [Mycobacterium tuberculosis]